MSSETENELGMLAPLDAMMHPYRERFHTFDKLPTSGRERAEILDEMEQMRALEQSRWKEGYASGSVYHGDDEHVAFVNRAYALQSQANQLHADLWPSAAKFEAEIVAMTAHMLSAGKIGQPFGTEHGICGSVTSGGSESILLAIKTYRDWARERRGIRSPELVLPVSAHAAFHKAAQFFNIEPKVVPLDGDFRADVAAVADAITPNTIALVGSAVNFPYGTIDPIDRMGALAQEHGVGLHVDGCLGGFLLPWAEKLGHAVPPFDFRVPGVTSMSCDTHKYGYAPKGTSVVLYRGWELRHYQYFTIADWPGGLYYSPTFSGSRPGGLSAACWAAMVSMGEAGYIEATRKILAAVATIRQGIDQISELRVLGQPIGPFAVASDQLDVYQVLDQMSARKWALTGLLKPPAIHVSPTLRQAQPHVAERFIKDLAESVAFVRDTPDIEGGMAPIYGLAASIPDRSIVHEMLKQVMDIYYRL
ncbi:MAG TPA: aminotransferase class V-fold PLP-dependent enzyme [Pirellulales bacterium]|nr:aminotransferase class V-fold PLP-dependent enzyme [Pirellulales bacterium]